MLSTLSIVALCIAGLLVGLAATLYLRFRKTRSERERRAKALSRWMARETATGSSGGESGGGDFGDDD